MAAGPEETMADALTSRRRWLTLIAMCFGLFMVMLDATIVSNALPTIQRDLKMSTTGLQWVNNAYTLVIGALVITTGRLGDLFGRRRYFMLGVIVFATGSALCGAAQTDVWLIASRAFEGIGAAFMTPLTLSIIDDAFPPEQRGRAIGIWAGISGLALAIGPLLGGVLTQDASWRWIFYVNLPVAALALVMTLRVVRESRDETSSRHVDLGGLVTVSAGLFGVVLGVMQGRSWGWTSAATIACLAGGAAFLALFIGIEARTDEPLIDLRLFRNPAFTGSNVVAFLVSFAMLGALFFLPLYMQDVRGYDPIGSGIAILPITLLVTIGAPVSGRLADRVGPRWPMAFGMAVMGIAFGVLVGISVDTTYAALVGPFVVLGAGIGMVMSPMSTAALNTVSSNQAGEASGVLNTNRQVGGTFGVAILGVIFSSAATGKLNTLVSGLPPQLRSRATSHASSAATNPSAVAQSAAHLPPAIAHQVVEGSKEVFVSGLSAILYVSAGVAVAGAVFALVLIRAAREVAVGPRPRAAPCSTLTHHHHREPELAPTSVTATPAAPGS